MHSEAFTTITVHILDRSTCIRKVKVNVNLLVTERTRQATFWTDSESTQHNIPDSEKLSQFFSFVLLTGFEPRVMEPRV